MLDKKVRLLEDPLGSFHWWLRTPNLKVCPWRQENPRILTTDASPLGWGAHLEDQMFQGTWDAEVQKRSSNYKELCTIFHALQATQEVLSGSHVRILSDNSTAIAYINKQGGTQNGELMKLSFEILSLAETKFLSLGAIHLRGKENVMADFLSRHMLQAGWCLNKQVFSNITSLWGMPEIDLFATKENHQVSICASLFLRGQK